MKRVHLMIIATSRYTEFLPELVQSVNNHFLLDCKVVINIFTDKVDETRDYFRDQFYNSTWRDLRVFHVEHKPFPASTLNRYHFFKAHKFAIGTGDYVFYIDADTIIKAEIKGEDVFSDRTVVRHCGFMDKRGSYENRQESTSYVAPHEGEHYYGGGFFGFSMQEFWKLVDKAINMINIDTAKGICPLWYDESVLNRYMIDNPPTKILTPSYHYPEGQQDYYKKVWGGIEYECKVLLLDKNHKEFQV